ncbi:MAG: flagellar export protein FliJ [Bdellovibrionota bacterium]
MKFKYSLEKVLKHREILESVAQREFQEMMGELVQAQNTLDGLFHQEKKARESLLVFQENSVVELPQHGTQLDHFLKLQALRIETQKTKVEAAQKRVEEKREILRAKAIDRKILVKHKEQKHELFTAEVNRKEQLEMDELSVLRHGVRKNK